MRAEQKEPNIESVDESGCNAFFRYLNDHRSDNGEGETGYFLPLSQSESRLPYDKEEPFRAGLNLPVGSPGWRRLWVARTPNRQIVGQVDLRSHPVRFAEHRCLLGMGVDRNHRRLGLGASLLSYATEWALANTGLEWLDLHVLSSNESALRLYLRAGFTKVGEVAEMFKFDGRLFSEQSPAELYRVRAWHQEPPPWPRCCHFAKTPVGNAYLPGEAAISKHAPSLVLRT
jgi:ribosomal protein S18 acetylase RimI-like enzyme